MKKVQPEQPEALARPRLYPATLCYAALISVGATAQLFTIDKILEHPHLQTSLGQIVLPLMVLVAIFSLPAVLRLATSRLMNLCSFLCAAALPITWLLFALYTQPIANDIGLLGTHLANPLATWLMTVAAVVLGFLNFLALGIPRLKK